MVTGCKSVNGKNCGGGCKSVNGKNCVFPFKYKGITHNKCITLDSTKPWCANRVDEKTGVAIHGEWADCEPGCEIAPIPPTPINRGLLHQIIKKSFIDDFYEIILL